MVKIKTEEEIEIMRQSALIVSRTLGLMAEKIAPGVTPLELDKIAYEYIKDQGAEPGFLGFGGFPNSLCISVNEAVVHGIPGKISFKEGDIVSIDCGAVKNGFYGDHAYSFAIGDVSEEAKNLLKVTKESLYLAIAQTIVGNRIGDIGYAIQHHAEKHGFGVVRELVGHGLGTDMHEDPQVPNYGKRGRGKKIVNGMVLAIEPMINLGTKDILMLDDDWTIVTADRKYSAHFEHDIAVVNGKPDILSSFDYVEDALEKRGLDAMRMGVDILVA
ncbi:type I methionyl aminopeptidase [Cryomorpha ignava]|uniref:Methionine aminopeptidase n=1 Tax=Cryomorpha ignava TaxID=101383 RepID=A0A7K3WNS0_9FLAO|nr:type I methionyl aminopeptidase [Cryomorpha ignava]NEN23300.1 type I methionyl aminopeptidase [Cryomorpha ignava]